MISCISSEFYYNFLEDVDIFILKDKQVTWVQPGQNGTNLTSVHKERLWSAALGPLCTYLPVSGIRLKLNGCIHRIRSHLLWLSPLCSSPHSLTMFFLQFFWYGCCWSFSHDALLQFWEHPCNEDTREGKSQIWSNFTLFIFTHILKVLLTICLFLFALFNFQGVTFSFECCPSS